MEGFLNFIAIAVFVWAMVSLGDEHSNRKQMDRNADRYADYLADREADRRRGK